MDPVALAEAGPWAIVVAIGIGLGLAFSRGWLVPRFVYDREVGRADRLETVVERNTEAIKALTDEVRRYGGRPGA